MPRWRQILAMGTPLSSMHCAVPRRKLCSLTSVQVVGEQSAVQTVVQGTGLQSLPPVATPA